MVDLEVLGEQPVLRADHVADGVAREPHPGLRGAGARRGGQPVSDGVGTDHEVPVGVERLARPDHEVEPMVVSREGGDHQDGVGPLRVQRPVGDIRDREVTDDLTALELEIAHGMTLVGRLIGAVRARAARDEDAQDEAAQDRHDQASHGRSSS